MSAVSLSRRQTAVWRELAMSETTKGIALKLGISAKTVEYHRAKLMARLHIFDIAGLTREAIKIGLITL